MGVAERRMVWDNENMMWLGVLFVQHGQAGVGRCGPPGLGVTIDATAWWLTPGTWRWAVSLEWSCHAEVAGTAQKLKLSLASPNWEQLLSIQESMWKGLGSRE